ncbi:outer membrane protein assembly factor BamE [Sneathiella glossodoripedis]|uniref:outer membrane protein assembly factor BamE n=1 Tax=Sneathiella glossodoripedis TaxID=418853 RepID=UPI00055B05EC|nr:outer membrane protein assembly factor BamE [Sneathiella glossodoripedis]
MKKFLALSICTSLAALSLVACDPVREERGYRLDPEQIALVETGVSSKDDVIEKMGSPTSISTFPDAGEAWYYIGKKTEHIAFLEKDIIEQNVIVIHFDQNEVVKEIKKYDKDDRREIEVVERTTPTGGNKLGFFEQIFGNFGRFNTGQ